jgi:hypothetical protein
MHYILAGEKADGKVNVLQISMHYFLVGEKAAENVKCITHINALFVSE